MKTVLTVNKPPLQKLNKDKRHRWKSNNEVMKSLKPSKKKVDDLQQTLTQMNA
jgi:hypothetical protein